MPDYQLTRGSTDELFMTVTRGAVKAKDLLGNQSLICCFFCQGISLRESLGNFSKTPINVKTKNHETKSQFFKCDCEIGVTNKILESSDAMFWFTPK